MRRNGFTMMELIVVIIIIGILAAAAIPQLTNVKNLAKINSEMSSMSSIDSAVMAEMETQDKRYGDTKVDWHVYTDMNDTAGGNRAAHYKEINDQNIVLSKVVKRNKGFEIVGYREIDRSGNSSYNDGLFYDAIMLKVEATKSTTGAKYPSDADGQDIKGEPDKNDFWIFNPSSVDLQIATRNVRTPINSTVIRSGEITLVDVNGTSPVRYITDVGVSNLTNNPAAVYYFREPAQ